MPATSSLAISLLLAYALGQHQAALEAPAWAVVGPSVAYLMQGSSPVGVASLIDDAGHFVAFQPHLGTSPIQARLGTGEPIALAFVAADDQTQLVLLRATSWTLGGRRTVSVSTSRVEGQRLLAVTPTGPTFGQLVDDGRLGILRPSLRYAKFSEVRIETTGPVGGTMLFDGEGRLVAILGATLAPEPPSPGVGQASRDGLREAIPVPVPKVGQYGPQPMTVAYSVSTRTIRRVVQGFLSPGRKVSHPTVGMLFRATDRPGAKVELVRPGEAADVAGLRAGDVVVAANGREVLSPRDLAEVLLELEIGDRLLLRVARHGGERSIEVVVGAHSGRD